VELFNLEGEWWVHGDDLEMDVGPYPTKAEANDDMQGMKRFLRHEHKPGYVTIESLRGKKS
jgi:hypothetical protein